MFSRTDKNENSSSSHNAADRVSVEQPPQLSLYDQRVKDILEDYYRTLDSPQFSEELLLKYYAPDCTAVLAGLPTIKSRQLVTRAIADIFSKIRMKHVIESMQFDPEPPKSCESFVSVTTKVSFYDDTPRKVFEIFEFVSTHLAEADTLVIKKHILVVQDSRPLYDNPIVSPGIISRPLYDNWEPQFKPPEPTLEELADLEEKAAAAATAEAEEKKKNEVAEQTAAAAAGSTAAGSRRSRREDSEEVKRSSKEDAEEGDDEEEEEEEEEGG